ncbi:hypothetical protein JCM19992_16100 [Thermostilla marina]
MARYLVKSTEGTRERIGDRVPLYYSIFDTAPPGCDFYYFEFRDEPDEELRNLPPLSSWDCDRYLDAVARHQRKHPERWGKWKAGRNRRWKLARMTPEERRRYERRWKLIRAYRTLRHPLGYIRLWWLLVGRWKYWAILSGIVNSGLSFLRRATAASQA